MKSTDRRQVLPDAITGSSIRVAHHCFQWDSNPSHKLGSQ